MKKNGNEFLLFKEKRITISFLSLLFSSFSQHLLQLNHVKCKSWSSHSNINISTSNNKTFTVLIVLFISFMSLVLFFILSCFYYSYTICPLSYISCYETNVVGKDETYWYTHKYSIKSVYLKSEMCALECELFLKNKLKNQTKKPT